MEAISGRQHSNKERLLKIDSLQTADDNPKQKKNKKQKTTKKKKKKKKKAYKQLKLAWISYNLSNISCGYEIAKTLQIRHSYVISAN